MAKVVRGFRFSSTKSNLVLETMLVLSLLLLTSGLALAVYEELDITQAEELFEQFMQDYNRVYNDDQEKQMRFNIFKEHLLEINEQNRRHGYNVMGINEFADISSEEFNRTHFGLNLELTGSCDPFKQIKFAVKAPESFDWREKGIVTEVKNQGQCGSCWAFSTVGNVESQYAKVHGADKLISLSEQQLVDCDKSNTGCHGGNMETAIMTLIKTNGLMSEADYPYTASEGGCQYDENKAQVKVTGCVDFSGTDEEDLKEILVNNGPITVALAGTPIQLYKGGVYKGCSSSDEINHGLLLVGYGTDPDTQDPYWIIKNSWGASFGENGYIRMVRGNPDCKVGNIITVSAQVA